MINDRFFSTVQSLQNKHTKKAEYNIFRALRTELDEVKLHSRLLYDLLNPKGSHKCEDVFLKLFLKSFAKSLRLDGFMLKEVKVDNEYKNIDILIRSGKTAIVIENKINAEDQPKQLVNYYAKMQDEGYEKIKLVYLTLEGRAPSKQSIHGLPQKVKDEDLILFSYKDDIYQWITACRKIAEKDQPLSQICHQYLNTISYITNKIENPKHMAELIALLNKSNNLENFPSLLEAYKVIKDEFQLDLWNRVYGGLKREFGKFYPELNNKLQSDKVQIKENKNGAKNNWIKIKINCYDNAYLVVLFKDTSISYGVQCEKGSRSKDYKAIAAKKDKIIKAYSTTNMPIAKNAEPLINFKNLSPENLKYLKDRGNRQKYANTIVKDLKEIAAELKLTLPKKKGFIANIFNKEAMPV